MPIKEFLFVDEKRLNSYAEQIGSPVTYDKVPIWSAELSLAGPKGGASQARHARLPTRSEKVDIILSHLVDNQLVINKRPGPMEIDATFVIEVCSATRVLVPAIDKSQRQSQDLILWISPPGEVKKNILHQTGLLCLLEDFRYSDNDGCAHWPDVSAYTLLTSVVRALQLDSRNTILVKPFQITDSENEQMNPYSAWRDYMPEFIANPVGTLEELGCIPGPSREIEVLYRVRELGHENFDWNELHPPRISVFGYPIYITTAS